MANFFDQFDEDENVISVTTPNVPSSGNFFDQFDEDDQTRQLLSEEEFQDPAMRMAMIPTGDTAPNVPLREDVSDMGYRRDNISFDPATDENLSEDRRTWNFGGSGLEQGIPPSFQRALGGVYNAPREMLEFPLAMRDSLTGENDLEIMQEVLDTIWPRYEAGEEAEGMVGNIVQEGAGFLTGAGALHKIAGRALKAIKGTRTGRAGRAVAYESAGVAGMDSDTESLTEPLRILGMTSDGSYSEEVALRKLNLIVEGIALAKGVELSARGIKGLSKLVKDYGIDPILSLGDPSKLENTVVKDAVLNPLRKISINDTPQTIAEEWRKVIKAVDEGKSETIPSGIEGVDDVTFKRDTMSALQEGIENIDPETTARARTLRAGVESRGSPELEAAMSQPSFEGDRFLREGRESFGGPEATTRSRESIQESALRDTDAYLDEIATAEKRVLESKEGIKSLVENDPELGRTLTELGDNLNIGFGSKVRESANEIVKFIQNASDLMTKRKNDLYDAIPERAIVNKEAYNDAVELVDDLLPDSFRKSLGEAGGNFKELNTLVSSKEFNKIISDMKRSDRWEDVGRLRSFKEAITDDQLDFFILSGDSEVADAARAAREYFANEYAPFWRNNPALRDIQQYSRDYRFSPDMKAVESRKALTKTITDPDNAEYTKKISELLDTPEGGRNASKLLDYSFGEIALDAQRMKNASPDGKLTSDQIVSLSRRLEDYVPIFENHPGQVERINSFLGRLKDQAFSTKELEDILSDTIKRADSAKKEILSTKGMDNFFDSSGNLKLDDIEVFSKSFDDIENLPEILRRAGPEGQEGIKAQYMDELQAKLFRSDEGPSGELLSKPISERDADKLFKAGDIIFKDNPEIMGAVRAIQKELAKSRSGTNKGKSTFDTSSARKSAGGIADFVITQIWGPLNRVGSRIRSAAGRAIATTDTQEQMKLILDRVMADPEEFLTIARRVEQDFSKRNKPRPENISDLYRFFVTSGVYGSRENPEDEMQFIEDFNNQYDEDYQTDSLVD